MLLAFTVGFFRKFIRVVFCLLPFWLFSCLVTGCLPRLIDTLLHSCQLNGSFYDCLEITCQKQKFI